VLPFIYPGIDANKILDDVENSDIPSLHKTMFSWIERFTRRSSTLTRQDIDGLRAMGVADTEIVEWVNVACTQTWFVMSADGGGIPLEDDAVVGSVIGHKRESYHKETASTVPETPPSPPSMHSDSCWVETDTAGLSEISGWATDRYGLVPNLLKSASLTPHYLPRHTRALELLEGPQSDSLSPRHHAMVRRLVNRRNQGSYFDATTRQQLARLNDTYDGEFDFSALNNIDQRVLSFADKMVSHAYKVTERDAQGFRNAGLDDEAYIDVLNTVSIQTSLDRLANALGVQADEKALLA
jgi:alkylhydroperoxidase family enzyme